MRYAATGLLLGHRTTTINLKQPMRPDERPLVFHRPAGALMVTGATDSELTVRNLTPTPRGYLVLVATELEYRLMGIASSIIARLFAPRKEP